MFKIKICMERRMEAVSDALHCKITTPTPLKSCHL